MQSLMLTKNKLYEIIKLIQQDNSCDSVADGLKILLKLFKNIINNPIDLKFRTIKTTNKVISEKLMTLDHIHEFLSACNFEINEGSYHCSDDIENIEISLSLIENAIKEAEEKVTIKSIARDSLKDEQVLKERKRAQKKLAEEKKAREDVLRMIEEDKKERRDFGK